MLRKFSFVSKQTNKKVPGQSTEVSVGNETHECESARNSVERKRKYVDDVRAEGGQLRLIVYHAPFGRGAVKAVAQCSTDDEPGSFARLY